MGRVEPASDVFVGALQKRALPHENSDRKHVCYVVLGLLYLVLSLACSCTYVTILAESLTNDYWWRQFNTTGAHTFLADVFSARLSRGVHTNATSLDLFSIANFKDYSQPVSFVDLRETAVRRWLLRPLPLKLAVETVRANSLYENIYTFVAPCWVDLGRQFEMAHTSIRQKRCLRNQKANAAVYMEAMLRNVGAGELLHTAFGGSINQTILTPVTTLPNGQEWVSALYAHEWLSVADEIALWQQFGLEFWTIQYQNRFHYATQD
ncbi:Aste57867_552 [Aphanomyces stellatus]|uniref:Aste57867_552 protein n=1 Tax=Aphanomyces stellatus TaxID=120398 RepID=A0A485K2W6_9STRA|nr:hypothetical protein As57867_000551 [Aphanomyces stellatus]VFT77777.1 Aste57867_552 [Aphanomyces stellatus]